MTMRLHVTRAAASLPGIKSIFAMILLAFPAYASDETTSVKEVWGTQFVQEQIPVTVFETEDMRVFALPVPENTVNWPQKGTPVDISQPDAEGGVETACLPFGDSTVCHENMLSELQSAYISELFINRILESEDPEVTILELNNLRLIAFPNHNRVQLSPGDPVNLYDDGQGRVYLCATGEHTICADEISLNEDSPFVPVENQTYTL